MLGSSSSIIYVMGAVFGADRFCVVEHPAIAGFVDGKRRVVAQEFIFAEAEFAGDGVGAHGAAAYGLVDRFCIVAGFGEFRS